MRLRSKIVVNRPSLASLLNNYDFIVDWKTTFHVCLKSYLIKKISILLSHICFKIKVHKIMLSVNKEPLEVYT